MLFDLRGRRRRVVQATYLMLALLLGGGLVLFGIGGDVSGGLFNAFEGDGGGGNPNTALEERIDKQEQRLQANPENTALLQSLVRDNYQLATAQQESGTTQFPNDAKDELRKAGAYWQRYVAAESEKPNADTALYALGSTTWAPSTSPSGRRRRLRSSRRRRTTLPPTSSSWPTRRLRATNAQRTSPPRRPWTWRRRASASR